MLLTRLSDLRKMFAFKGESLRHRALQSGTSVLAGQLYSNFIRLAGNLIMTRLLYPEAFGLMLIVSVFVTGLTMLSDVGIRDAIISRKAAIDASFINTAWTVTVVRGLALAAISIALAGPVADYYGEAELEGLIYLASAIPAVQGLASPQAFVHEKQVRQGRVVLWNLCSITVSLLVTVSWLLIEPTIWALAANGVIAAAIASVSSYFMFPSAHPRLCWDKEVVSELFRFGRWVFIGTALTFFARQGDSLIISKWISAAELGLFGIAAALAKLPETIIGKLNAAVLFPVYAELQAGENPQILQKQRKVKLAMFALSVPMVLAFSLFGRDIIELLYDPRYHDAGWVLEILGAASLFFAVGAPIRPLPLSFRDSFTHMTLQCAMVVSLLACMTVGGMTAGFLGLVIGIAAAQLIDYLALRWAVSKYGIRGYGTDLIFIAAMLLVITTVWYVRGWPSVNVS